MGKCLLQLFWTTQRFRLCDPWYFDIDITALRSYLCWQKYAKRVNFLKVDTYLVEMIFYHQVHSKHSRSSKLYPSFSNLMSLQTLVTHSWSSLQVILPWTRPSKMLWLYFWYEQSIWSRFKLVHIYQADAKCREDTRNHIFYEGETHP